MENITNMSLKEMRDKVYAIQKQILDASVMVKNIKGELHKIHKAKPDVFIRAYQNVVDDIRTIHGVDITLRNRTQSVVAYRACMMHTMLEMFDMSLSEVGLLCGKKDHSTVIHARKKVDDYISVNDEYYSIVKRNVVEIFNNYF